MVTVCVASRRSIRRERAEERSGVYGRGPHRAPSARPARRSGRAPGRDPKGGAFRPTAGVKALARCPASCAPARVGRATRCAPFLLCRPESAAQTMTLVRKPS